MNQTEDNIKRIEYVIENSTDPHLAKVKENLKIEKEQREEIVKNKEGIFVRKKKDDEVRSVFNKFLKKNTGINVRDKYFR